MMLEERTLRDIPAVQGLEHISPNTRHIWLSNLWYKTGPMKPWRVFNGIAVRMPLHAQITVQVNMKFWDYFYLQFEGHCIFGRNP